MSNLLAQVFYVTNIEKTLPDASADSFVFETSLEISIVVQVFGMLGHQFAIN